MGKYKAVLLVILAIIFISCAPTRKATVDYNIETYLERISVRDKFVRTLNANGSVTLDSPELSGTAKIEVNLVRPDILTLKVETIFGIDLGEAHVYCDNFEIFDRFNDLKIQGKVSNYIKKYLGVDFACDELIDILIGCPRIQEFEVQNFSANELIMVSKREGKSDVVLKFNPEFELESYVLFRDGVKIFEVRYSRYKKFGEITLPRLIKIYDEFGRGIYLSFSEVELNG
ncbi:MAG: DUF4292 domain-containing protein [Candidatus Kryptonium sp.]|nr:DUF4292 domain-containing protein [Candidatus Kryptonium sp.]MCX7761461.1 DUF4292 domain-containing protein [Candidatus Kryptonium sp.]MDW8109684.1 DUF4292 domain-containing protein [Candidatus Kryptonium sp.]